MSTPASAVSLEFRHARLQAMQAWLDAGDGNARIYVMGGEWPGAGVDGGTVLAVMDLDKPCGRVEEGLLILDGGSASRQLVQVTGEARWARIVSAAGHWAVDCGAAHKDAGKAGLMIEGGAPGPNGGVQLYKGGLLPPVRLCLT
ncbi:MAG: hypothetical protein Q4A28_06145 [Brachymonas sp.]|nr:hypothetical protein [Brachymonas sp.]